MKIFYFIYITFTNNNIPSYVIYTVICWLKRCPVALWSALIRHFSYTNCFVDFFSPAFLKVSILLFSFPQVDILSVALFLYPLISLIFNLLLSELKNFGKFGRDLVGCSPEVSVIDSYLSLDFSSSKIEKQNFLPTTAVVG